MRKDNPEFSPQSGEVRCEDCPFTDEDGELVGVLCGDFVSASGAPYSCPTAATYQVACEFAEAHKEAP